jgi:hypothetical protein
VIIFFLSSLMFGVIYHEDRSRWGEGGVVSGC